MKRKSIALIASFLGMAAAASAQSLMIAGWDFSQYPTSGLNTIDNASFNGTLNANFSDYNSPTAKVTPFYGTLYYDGQFGSTATTFATFDTSVPEVQPVTGSLLSARNQPGDGLFMSDFSSKNQLQVSGQEYWADIQLLIKNPVSIVFSASAFASTDWTITYAAKDFGAADGVTISWDYSTDGSAYTPSGVVHNITTADSAYTASFAALDGASTIYLRANLANVNTAIGEFTTIDNVGISAVPEPSTYALIAGVLAIGVIARRRFRKVA